MRLLITAISAQEGASASLAATGSGQLKSRLGREDAAFEVVEADPGRDLAEQIEALLAERGPSFRDSVMLYVACSALLSIDGELFLSLDPQNPTVGDALADVAAVLRDGAPGPKLVVLELADTKLGLDPTRAEVLVRAAEAATDPNASGIELLLGARPRTADTTSLPLAQAIVAELDALPSGRTLTSRGLFDRLLSKLRESVPCLHHARAKVSFELAPGKPGRRDSTSTMPAPRLDVLPRSATPAPPVALPLPPAPPLPAEAPRMAPPAVREPEVSLAAPRPPRTFHPPPPTDDVDLTWTEEGEDWGSMPRVIPLARPLAAPPGASLPPPPMASSGSASILGTDGPISSPISGREISPFARYTVEGELLASQDDVNGAIAAFRKALSVLGPAGDPHSRAEMYVRIGELRSRHGEPEDAISDFEKALALRPGHIPALESLLLLCVSERDWRGVMSAEERLLAALPSDTLRFERLIEFAARWEGVADKPARARLLFERAREMRPNDPIVLEQIRRLTLKSLPPAPRE
ncbi:tetratricopeptide repeat protein [Polyangium sp. y55x31]|uniref:tetratricopeptide repeat protein n=1 Tax=Polyangium sp. y55x31 TaxID=3042688 RepID=UPI002482490C|nr:tetratricopeptide repeat protein [Polyangium sp. y55x31]MDI1481206.1 tetratricopeptide repeat protein [Polyangium sp. y55x31]